MIKKKKTTPLRVAGLAGRALPAMVEHTADKLVDRALAQRTDLLARVAQIRAHEADIRKAQSDFYPRIVVSGNVLQNIGRVRVTDVPGWAGVNDTGYGAAIAIEMPLFDGGLFFFSSRRRHTRCLSDWSSDVCSSD